MAQSKAPSEIQPTSVMARARVRVFLREQIQGQDRVVLADLTDRALAFAMDNPDTMRGLLSEMLKPMVHNIAQQVVAETRTGTVPIILQGADLVALDRSERTTVLRPRFAYWLEYDGVCHTRLMRMNREQLKAAAGWRLNMARRERVVAQLWEELASELQDGQVVEDHFTVEEIETRYITIEESL